MPFQQFKALSTKYLNLNNQNKKQSKIIQKSNQSMSKSKQKFKNQPILFQLNPLQLITEIQKSSQSTSLYHKLQNFDKVLKKYHVDQLDEVALEIYEYLVQKDAVNQKKQKQKQNNNAKPSKQLTLQNKQLKQLKLSLSKKTLNLKHEKNRNNLHEYSPKHTQQIQDPQNQQQQPETPSMNLFSFAKAGKQSKDFSNLKLKGTKLSFNQSNTNANVGSPLSFNTNNANHLKCDMIQSLKSRTEKASSKSASGSGSQNGSNRNISIFADKNKGKGSDGKKGEDKLIAENSKMSIKRNDKSKNKANININKNNVSSFSLCGQEKLQKVKKSKKNFPYQEQQQPQQQQVRELYLSSLSDDHNHNNVSNLNLNLKNQNSQIRQTEPNQQELFLTERNKSEKTLDFIKLLNQKRLNEFFMCIKKEKSTIKKLFKNKVAKFFYYQTTLKKCMRQLALNWKNQLILQKRAQQHASFKEEQILEQYFLQWKARAKMSDFARQKQSQIDQKSIKLMGKVFFMRLKNFTSQIKQKLYEAQQVKKQQKQMTVRLVKTIFMRNFIVKMQNIKKQKVMQNQIKIKIQKNQSKMFFALLNLYQIRQKEIHQKNVNLCSKRINSKRIIEKLMENFNFLQVYWKGNKNISRIYFLSMFLETLKEKFERDGYMYGWMSQLQQNLRFADEKLKNPLKIQLKIKAFQGLKQYFQEQKQKKAKIMSLFGQRFLKCLAVESFKRYKNQSLQQKSLQLIQFRHNYNSYTILQNLVQQSQNSITKKTQNLTNYYKKVKVQQTLRYLEAYKQNKRYYQQKIDTFTLKSNKICQQKYFYLIKRVLKQKIINKKLIQEYHNLKARILQENCFNEIKGYIFKKKLTKKKQTNFNKLLMVKYFDKFIVGIRNTKNQKTQRQIKICVQNIKGKIVQKKSLKIVQNLRQNVCKMFLKREIKNQIQQTLKSHLKRKIFEVLKFICKQNQQEKRIGQKIRQNYQRKSKKQLLQKMIKILLLHEGIRRLSILQTPQYYHASLKEAFYLLKAQNNQ